MPEGERLKQKIGWYPSDSGWIFTIQLDRQFFQNILGANA